MDVYLNKGNEDHKCVLNWEHDNVNLLGADLTKEVKEASLEANRISISQNYCNTRDLGKNVVSRIQSIQYTSPDSYAQEKYQEFTQTKFYYSRWYVISFGQHFYCSQTLLHQHQG